MKANILLFPAITAFAITGFSWYGKTNHLLTMAEVKPIVSFESSVDDTLKLSPTVLVETEKNGMQPLLLNECSIRTTCNGSLLETEMELTYENKEDRVLEGSFYFPLYSGQFITGLELEQDGKFREASIVKKDVGRIAFEATERKQVDPALLEWAQGNNFKLRVYPIPAKGKKKIRIRYAQALKQNEQGLYFDLPLHFQDRLKNMDIQITFPEGTQFVTSSEDKTLVSNAAPWEYKVFKKDVYANQPIRFQIPMKHRTSATVTTNHDHRFLTTHIEVPETERTKAAPQEMTILWDVSSSAAKRDLERERTVLVTYLKRLKKVTLHVLAFSNDVHYREEINWSNDGNADQLFTKLANMPNDGATQIGCLKQGDLQGDEILLFSDCLSNFGSDQLPLQVNQRLIVLSSSPEKDYSRALRYAQKNGDVIALNELSTEECLNRLQHEPLRLLHVKGIPDSLVTGIGKPVDHFFVNALLLPEKTTTNLEFEFGTGNEVVNTVSVVVPESLPANELGERYWAHLRLQDLDLDFEANELQMTHLALDQGLVSRFTSLLVLDALDDYLKYDILPPKELQEAYFKRKTNQEKTDKKEIAEHDEMVLSRWKEIKSWYATVYKRRLPKKEDTTSVGYGQDSMGEPMLDAMIMENRADAGSAQTRFVTSSVQANATYSMIVMDENKNKTTEEKSVSVQLEEWDPKTPYMKKIKAVSPEEAYTVYLQEKAIFGNQPSFFIDVSDYFRDKGKSALALRVLSNLAELELENPQLLRVLAHRLDQIKEYDLAISVFRNVKKLRPEEPQSYRDLALVLEKNGQYKAAEDEFKYVIDHTWDSRFRDIEVISLVEWNHMLRMHPELKSQIDAKYKALLPVDTRVILTWDTDNCDMDLWVTDPYGEKCFYSHTLTEVGGRISADCTQGYGPEEFMLKLAPKGTYKVKVNYYGSSAQTVTGPTTIQMKMITNYGKPNEKVIEITRRLSDKKEIISIGEFEVQ